MHANAAKLSKFLSYILRHKPDSIGLVLDSQGWASIDELIAKSDVAGTAFNREQLLEVVSTNDKKRFSISADGQRIRAAQGHSVTVDLDLPPQAPPAVLYHGTATQFIESICATGLTAQNRQQVHLSADEKTAHRVGQRHGTPIVLTVDAARMYANGFAFFLADNGVWLTERVPPEFLTIPIGEADAVATTI